MILNPDVKFHKKDQPRIKSVTIMPAAIQNKKTLDSVTRAVCSHGFNSRLVVMINHTHRYWLGRLACRMQGTGHAIMLVPPGQPLNLNVFYMMGAHLTEASQSEYLVYANSDVVFHPHWDTTLFRQWEDHPEREKILSFHAHSGTKHGSGPSYRNSPGQGVLESDAPLMQAWAIRRDTKWRFDTRFDFFNTDCDFWLEAKRNGLKMMVSQEARVDHINSVSRQNFRKFPPVMSIEDSNELMRRKWGSAYHG